MFLLVAKGRSGLFRKAMDLNIYSIIRMGSSNLIISHLHFEDDSLFLAEATIDNLWLIKAILQGFELV